MFSSLRLFSQVVCPDAECSRDPCLFSHDPAMRKKNAAAGPSTIKGQDQVSDVAGRGSTAINADAGPSKGPAKSQEPPSKVQKTQPIPALDVKPKVPILIADPKTSRQNLVDRKKALQRLFEEFCRLYANVISLDPSLPSTSALAQEQETALHTQKNNYNQAIHSALVRIRGRPKPKDLDSPYIGTVKESQAKELIAEEEKASRLTKENVRKYLLPKGEFGLWGYMTSVPDEPGHTEPNAIAQEKTCDRCKQKFLVSGLKDYRSMLDTSEKGECKHHWGRTLPERVDGQRMWLYTCCREPRGSEGCSDALHVFKDGRDKFRRTDEVVNPDEPEEEVLMHRRVEFRTTEEVHAEIVGSEASGSKKRKRESVRDIVALDCEMIYTTGGMALARVSVTDEDGKLILDSVVKQHNVALDLNTRFSGLQPSDMDKAAKDIWQVRRELCEQVGPETTIIGHGLENDLKALRLVHFNVIDTAALFPHIKGPPYRRALRDVTTEKLGVFVQTNIESDGHDSAEDARAALNLVKYLVKKDVGFGR